MSQHHPRLSIGMPVYNGERYLNETIESTLSQTFSDFELIICDNASVDATEQICRRHAARDPRVRYVRNERNIGANANFNRVEHLSDRSAAYFRWAAHDDLCAPSYLERCIQKLDENETAVLCHSRTCLVDTCGRPLSRESSQGVGQNLPSRDPARHLDSTLPQQRFAEVLLQTQWCFEIFGVMRKAALHRTWMQENYYGTDKVILATLALIGPFLEVPEELFFRRCHDQQSTSIRSANDRAAWSDPCVRRAPVLPQLPCLRGYIRAASGAMLFPAERVACRLAILRYLMQPRKLVSLVAEGIGRQTEAGKQNVIRSSRQLIHRNRIKRVDQALIHSA